jgi:hypothetical protein
MPKALCTQAPVDTIIEFSGRECLAEGASAGYGASVNVPQVPQVTKIASESI